ncbi:MAG: hypothetical protein PGN09_06760 [Sphingomonas fennica]
MTPAALLHAPSGLRRREPAGASAVSLRDVLNILFYYRRPALIVAGSVLAIGILLAILMPPRYNAEARLLTLNAGYYDLRDDAAQAGAPPPALDPTAVANVEMQLLSSAELHRQVVTQDLGPGASRATVDAALQKFESKLHIAKVQTANVIDLSYTDRDPVRAADVLSRLLAAYFRERGGVLTSGRFAFLTTQRDKAKADLDRANAQITAYQAQHDVVDVGAQIASAVALDASLRQQKLDAEAQIAQATGGLGRMRADQRSVPQTIELYSDTSEAARSAGVMREQLLALRARRADLASRYMAGSPFLKQIDQQVAALEGAVQRAEKELMVSRRVGYNAYYDTVRDRVFQADTAVASARARSVALDRQIAESTARLHTLNTVADVVQRLRTQRDILADSYRRFATQVEQARIQQNEASSTGSTNVRVIEAPVIPNKRSNPPLLFVAASIVAAILLAGVAVFLMSSVRETFLSPQEAERKLRLPVLSAPLEGEDGVPQRPDYSRLIAAIDQSAPGRAKVALLLAARGEDGLDPAAEGLYRALGERAPGRVVAVDAEGARADAGEGWVARSGDRLLAELRRAYDYILLVAPPMATSFEGVEMARMADAVVLVIRAEVTRRPVAADVIHQVQATGAAIDGLVMSGRRRYIPDFIYRML